MLYGYGMRMTLSVLTITFIVGIIAYAIESMAHMKALKYLGYDKPWIAWIPLANYYGFADAVSYGQENVMMFGRFQIPAWLFKFWWVAKIVIAACNPNHHLLQTILSTALNIIFLGSIYAKMYAVLENRTERDTQIIGRISGFMPLIAVIKFLIM